MSIGGLDDYAQALGAAQQLVPNWRQGDLVEAKLQGDRLQNQTQQIAIDDHAKQAAYVEQRRTAFQGDLGALGAKPTPDAYRALAVKYPEFHEVMDSAAKGLVGEQAQSLVKRLAPVQSLISAGMYDDAAKEVKRHIDADVAAGGQPDPDDQQMYDSLTSGDPAKQKAVGGLASALLYQLDPEHAAKGLQETGDNANHFVALGDGQVLNQRTGEVTGERREKPEYKTVDVFDADGTKIGERVITLGAGGGGQASGGGAAGAAPAGRTVGGWTPSSANGGDNAPAVTAGKITGAAKFLGVGPGDDISGMSPRKIAEAMTLSEGGSGTLADRNNNPANIKYGDFARKMGATKDPNSAYAVFPSKDAGLSAAAQLVAGKLKRGQTTVQTMVAGLPVGGQAAAGSGGGSNVVYESVGVPGAKASTDLSGDALERAAAVYMQTGQMPTGLGRQGVTQKAILNKAAEIAKAGGTTPEQQLANWQDYKTHQSGLRAFATGVEARTVRSLNVTIDHLDTLQNAAQALQNGNVGVFNRVRQSWARATGSAVPTNFEGVRQIVSAEVAKAISGGNTALADRQDLAHSISSANSPQQLAGYIAEVKKLMAGQLQGLAGQYQSATGRNDFASRLSARTRHALGGDAQPAVRAGATHVSASGAYSYFPGRGWVKN